MARRIPQKFFRQQTQSWYVEIDGQQHPLGNDEAEADTKYFKLMAGRQEVGPDMAVAEIVRMFLDWNADHRGPGTHSFYSRPLISFVELIGVRLKVKDLKPYHVHSWADNRYKGKSGNYRRTGIRAIQRAFNWAVEMGYVDRSPVKGIKKPAEKPRDVLITPAQWGELVEVLKARGEAGAAFLDLLTLMRLTGCRPMEARTVEARHIDRKARCIVFEREMSKGESEQRTVEKRTFPLTDDAFAICSRLALKNPSGPLFRNSVGEPWSCWDMKDWFGRISTPKKRKGQKAATPDGKSTKPLISFRLCAYAIRHTWATEALERGVDPISVATLMGHKDLKQLMKTYQHLNRKSEHLRAMMHVAVGEPLSAVQPAAHHQA